MHGRPDSDTGPETADSEAPADQDESHDLLDESGDLLDESGDFLDESGDLLDEPDDLLEDARRARWTAAGTGAALTLAGLTAALLRLIRSAPALVPAAYAGGAAVCAAAAVLGSRGRTRRALWLLIAGVMAMALGDQFD
ncbi:hypothetical protein SAMN06272771_5567 [Streptomyces sp. Ag82_O1-12]|uniref:hypothetical protein n=1 Tax=unclassified Streptomyces TaxID=2593676 RepID=UPI000BDAD013|nr:MULTISPECIES: hypothetical protein [unclassified Streptomyces]SMQ19100.1 hypothetical protein SAMN06272771_5567 [Streptomyces sp. Ag82_O1-12]SOD48141.1 hypothetical protein SAMN06272727_5570 [Streptomyces sp. Ag82_G6-1]